MVDGVPGLLSDLAPSRWGRTARRIHRLAWITLILLVVGVPAQAETQQGGLVFSGSGWGDGVGLSQYGARAMGDHGDSPFQILEHYYPGAAPRTVETLLAGSFLATDETPVWVGLLQNQYDVAFRVMSGSADLCFDETDECVATPLLEDKWRFGPDGEGGCAYSRETGDGDYFTVSPSGSCSGSIRPVMTPTTVSIPIKGRAYRHGTVRFRTNPSSGRLHAAFEIGIDDYVKGVQELPDSWPRAALQAQSIASRSLIVQRVDHHGPAETFDSTRISQCFCHIRDDDPEQGFGGYTAEEAHPVWQGLVEGTAGQVMAFGNEVIEAKFTSSTGGRTERNDDVGGPLVAYLVSVDDSISLTSAAANPFTRWTVSADQHQLGRYYGFSWLNDAEITGRNESGSAATVRLRGIILGRPAEVLVSGADVRAVLGLPSAYFEVKIENRFTDVASDHPFAGEILGLEDLGITEGCGSGAFCPGDGVTRGEMAAFLARALNFALQPGGDPFTDDDETVFEAEIETIRLHGITVGCTPTAYCPERTVKRGEMAAFLVRAFDLEPAEGDSFTDDDGSLFEADIEALRAAGVTSGCTPTMFCPEDPVTREQMAAFLIRVLAPS